MKINFLAAMATGLCCCALSPMALAQSYPESGDFGEFSPWQKSEDALGGSVSTEFAGGDVMSTFTVDRYNVGNDSAFTFYLSHIVYEPGFSNQFKSLFDQDIGDQISVKIDGKPFPIFSAYMAATEEGGIGVDINVHDPDDQTSEESWNKNCAVVTALSKARDIRVGLATRDLEFQFTGRGSTQALSDLRCS